MEKYLDAELTSIVATQLQDSLNDLEENYANRIMRRTWVTTDLVRINAIIVVDNSDISTTRSAITAAENYISSRENQIDANNLSIAAK